MSVAMGLTAISNFVSRLISHAGLYMAAPASALTPSTALTLWARAGGGGGGHSSGGGHSYGGSGGGGGGAGLFDLIFILFRMGPIGWIILAVLIYIAYRVLVNSQSSGNDSIPSVSYSPTTETPVLDTQQALGGESLVDFQKKVAQAFVTIQAAWSEQRVDTMRRFISDGVYQRFHAQFTMMNLLGQKNPITDVVVRDVQIVKSSTEGGYQCLDIAVSASATDQFICEKFPGLNSPGGNEAFVEYWSFIRRLDYKRGSDIFHTESCPKCSAPLNEKLVETARCPYCGTYLNSGEYDWVLDEITQEGDYGHKITRQLGLPALSGVSADQVRAVYPEFSEHVVEDRASNAFMQVLIATATRDLGRLKKFTTDALFGGLSQALPADQFVYDRLYTRAVDLLGLRLQQNEKGSELRAYVAVEYDFHQIDLTRATRFLRVPDQLSTDTKILVLVRTLSEITTRGSVFAGSCPSCGAPVTDALAVSCAHCGTVFNDSRLDWIVEDLMTVATYRGQVLNA